VTHTYDLKLTLDENGDLVPAAVNDDELLAQLKTRIHARLREPPLPEAIRLNVHIKTIVECTVELDTNDPHTVMVTYKRPPSIISFYDQIYAAARDVTPCYIQVKVNEVTE
jgi:hypothetical protein